MIHDVLPAEVKFSKVAINIQLQKILRSPHFRASEVLKRFLTFIVEQTLMGHAGWLKEYTIGVKVLNKPPDFWPQENCIVRIHAGRLRRALHHYYQQAGTGDAIYISIPKGGYIPAFSNNKEIIEDHIKKKTPARKPIVMGVLPFHLLNDNLSFSFTDGLCLQLGNAMMRFEKVSIVAYHLMRNLFERENDIRALASLFGLQYIIAGNIQSTSDRVRVNIEMIESGTGRQVWSGLFENEFKADHVFELQDEIVEMVISALNMFCKARNGKVSSDLLAVA